MEYSGHGERPEPRSARIHAVCGQEVRNRDPIQHGTVVLQQCVHSVVLFRRQIDTEVRPELARVIDDDVADRLTFGVVSF